MTKHRIWTSFFTSLPRSVAGQAEGGSLLQPSPVAATLAGLGRLFSSHIDATSEQFVAATQTAMDEQPNMYQIMHGCMMARER